MPCNFNRLQLEVEGRRGEATSSEYGIINAEWKDINCSARNRKEIETSDCVILKFCQFLSGLCGNNNKVILVENISFSLSSLETLKNVILNSESVAGWIDLKKIDSCMRQIAKRTNIICGQDNHNTYNNDDECVYKGWKKYKFVHIEKKTMVVQ